MQQVVEQLKAAREWNRKMLRMSAICLGVSFEEEILEQIKNFSKEAEAANEALRAILGDHWETIEEMKDEEEGA